MPDTVETRDFPGREPIETWVKNTDSKPIARNDEWIINTIVQAFDGRSVEIRRSTTKNTKETIEDAVGSEIVVNDDDIDKDIRSDLYRLYDAGMVRNISIDNETGDWTFFFFTLEIPEDYI